MQSYLSKDGFKAYQNYLSSPQGQVQQSILWQAISQHLPQNPLSILDAGTGNGWLTNLLKTHLPNTKLEACDSSSFLIEEAQKSNPEINFQIADLQQSLPYTTNEFDVIIANMVLHDIPNLPIALQNLSKVLAPNGVLLTAIPNPYYAFPVGVWKRGISKLWNALPKFKLIPENYFKFANKKIAWNTNLQSHFYPMPNYFKSAQTAGLYIDSMSDIYSKTSSKNFNLHYQLHQFPILVLVTFKKLH
jgi:SAM-dependent methyltransferase